MFIEPMLASPMPTDLKLPRDRYVAERKHDGHRLIVRIGGGGVQNDLFMTGSPVRAWSRDGLSRVLPRHIVDSLAQFPVCVLDGELLVPGKRSYGVTELSNAANLVFVAFDVIEMLNTTCCDVAYRHRRHFLETMFADKVLSQLPGIQLSWSKPVQSIEEITALCSEVWAEDGEGLVLKDRESLYYPGKRPKNVWIKIKQLRSAVLTITGYEYGLLGPYAKVKLVDEDGNQIAVKVRNTELRNRITANPNNFLGKKLRIEFQERTPDGSYRHPRWDRLEDE
jgi:ATP-dependent DNA ligase